MGASTTITTVVGVVTIGKGATSILTFVLLSFEEYEEFEGGSYTNDLLYHLLKFSTYNEKK